MIEAKLTYVLADAVPEQAAAKEGEPDPPKRYSFIVRASTRTTCAARS
jgi:hypothetical protein